MKSYLREEWRFEGFALIGSHVNENNNNKKIVKNQKMFVVFFGFFSQNSKNVWAYGPGQAKNTRGPWALTLCLRTWPMTKVPGRYGRIFQRAIFRHETWPLAKVAHIVYFYPRGSKWSLFMMYRQWFPIYGSIFEIAIFGHETWPLAKVAEVAHIGCVSLPLGLEI